MKVFVIYSEMKDPVINLHQRGYVEVADNLASFSDATFSTCDVEDIEDRALIFFSRSKCIALIKELNKACEDYKNILGSMDGDQLWTHSFQLKEVTVSEKALKRRGII